MSRKGNCWDNAPQESFFGHMKDELSNEIPKWTCFDEARRSIDDWIDYYNNDRYQWDLAKLFPNEYYHYLKTGVYPCLIWWVTLFCTWLGEHFIRRVGQGGRSKDYSRLPCGNGIHEYASGGLSRETLKYSAA